MSGIIVLIVLIILAYILHTRRHNRRFRKGRGRRGKRGGWPDFGEAKTMQRLLVSIGVLIVAGGVALLAMGGI